MGKYYHIVVYPNTYEELKRIGEKEGIKKMPRLIEFLIRQYYKLKSIEK